MKTLGRYATYLFLLVMTFNLTSCELEEEEGTDGGQIAEGEIYLKIVQDLSHPPGNNAQWCDLISGCYTDNNPGMPNNATFGQFFGPLSPGAYQASYCFDRNNPSSNSINFTYTLERPEPGKKRLYTRIVRYYNSSLNRCLDVSNDPSYMSFSDESL